MPETLSSCSPSTRGIIGVGSAAAAASPNAGTRRKGAGREESLGLVVVAFVRYVCFYGKSQFRGPSASDPPNASPKRII